MWPLRSHRTVLNARTLSPLGDGLRIDPVARTQRLDRSRRSLYCRSDGVSGRGASVKYLSHSVSLAVAGILPPPHRGTKQLGSAWLIGSILTLGVPLSMVIERHFSLRIKLTAYIVYMIAWCLVPAVLLALGALPWLGRKATMRARGATGL